MPSLPLPTTNHSPFIYLTALGGLAGVWMLFGSIGFAYQFGNSFYAYFCALAIACFFAPVLLVPVLRLSKTHQLTSLADLLAFRYQHQLSGSLTAVCLSIILLPLIALHFEAIHVLLTIVFKTEYDSSLWNLFLICVLAMILIISQAPPGKRLTLLACFSMIKLISFSGLTLYIFKDSFGSWSELNEWLDKAPRRLDPAFPAVMTSQHWSLMLAWFCAPITLPHAYQLFFCERPKTRTLRSVTWSLPLYLWVVAFSIPFIIWAASYQLTVATPEALLFALVAHHPVLAACAGLTVLCALFGVLIPLLVNLSNALCKHTLLPIQRLKLIQQPNLLQQIKYLQQMLIIALLLLSYGFYTLLEHRLNITALGVLTLLGTLQFIPGIIGSLFWPRGTAYGMNAGLIIGMLVWLFGLFIPIFAYSSTPSATFTDPWSPKWQFGTFDLGYSPTINNWQIPAMLSIMLNVIFFIVVSLVTRQSAQQKFVALQCTVEHLPRLFRGSLDIHTTQNMRTRLAQVLPLNLAEEQINQALTTLHLTDSKHSLYQLRRIREQLKANLTGLLGPMVAKELLSQALPFQTADNEPDLDIHFIEQSLAHHPNQLTGMAAELDQLRRYHRELLNHLPLGIITLSNQGEILNWNQGMQALSSISTHEILGTHYHDLPDPWHHLVQQALEYAGTSPHSIELTINSQLRWFNVLRSHLQANDNNQWLQGIMLVIEDWTEFKLLQHQVAHTDRLAAIGQLAAGVAHEIGNPVTAIACLAQELKQEPEKVQLANHFLNQSQRISDIVQSLTQFSHQHPSAHTRFEPIDLNACMQHALQLIQYSEKAKTREFIVELEPDLWCLGDRQRIEQVMINLLDNACDASPEKQAIRMIGSSDASSVTVSIEDQGHGIPQALQSQVFEPFITTKPVGEGTGLGLYLAYTTLQEHNGQIKIMSPLASGQGTRITLQLPKACS